MLDRSVLLSPFDQIEQQVTIEGAKATPVSAIASPAGVAQTTPQYI